MVTKKTAATRTQLSTTMRSFEHNRARKSRMEKNEKEDEEEEEEVKKMERPQNRKMKLSQIKEK